MVGVLPFNTDHEHTHTHARVRTRMRLCTQHERVDSLTPHLINVHVQQVLCDLHTTNSVHSTPRAAPGLMAGNACEAEFTIPYSLSIAWLLRADEIATCSQKSFREWRSFSSLFLVVELLLAHLCMLLHVHNLGAAAGGILDCNIALQNTP